MAACREGIADPFFLASKANGGAVRVAEADADGGAAGDLELDDFDETWDRVPQPQRGVGEDVNVGGGGVEE